MKISWRLVYWRGSTAQDAPGPLWPKQCKLLTFDRISVAKCNIRKRSSVREFKIGGLQEEQLVHLTRIRIDRVLEGLYQYLRGMELLNRSCTYESAEHIGPEYEQHALRPDKVPYDRFLEAARELVMCHDAAISCLTAVPPWPGSKVSQQEFPTSRRRWKPFRW